jgi:hypothetical protein
MMTKFCYKCKENKPLDAFGKNKSKKDGLSTECKPCKRTQDKQYYAKNSDSVKAVVAEYKTKNPEKVAQVKKNWYLENKQKFRVAAKKWKAANKEKHYKSLKKYRINNPGKRNFLTAKYRAIKLEATPPWFEKEQIRVVYKKAKEWGFAVDHIVPLKGETVCGLHCWANLQLLDPSLNSSKSNKYWPDMP